MQSVPAPPRLLATDWHQGTNRPFLCWHGSEAVPAEYDEIVTLIRLFNGPAEYWRVHHHWYKMHENDRVPRDSFRRAVEAALLDERSGLYVHFVNARCRRAAA